MSEAPVYKKWNTPTGMQPIVVRYGDYGWDTHVKVGDEWVQAEYLRVEYDPKRSRYASVTLRIPGHLSFERLSE